MGKKSPPRMGEPTVTLFYRFVENATLFRGKLGHEFWFDTMIKFVNLSGDFIWEEARIMPHS
jgi:hypothetical protein